MNKGNWVQCHCHTDEITGKWVCRTRKYKGKVTHCKACSPEKRGEI